MPFSTLLFNMVRLDIMEPARGIAVSRIIITTALTGLLALAPAVAAQGQANAPALKLLISPDKPFVADPEPVRIHLHIHNSTPQTLWLYRRAKARHPPEQRAYDEKAPPETTGGSTVEVKLQPVDAQAAQSAISPAEATVLEYVLMPKPRLVRLEAGDDYDETSIVRLHPALADGEKPIWGAYRVAMVYAASFSNADEFQRILGANLWQGEVTSNAITIELRPALPDSVGVLSGSALTKDLKARLGIRVSLQKEDGLLIDQQITGEDGKFSFSRLPPALYWVTGRQEGATEDTVVYRHQELTRSAPSADVQLVFYPQEISDAYRVVHKPTLFRVFDPSGQPLGRIDLDAVFSNGMIIDDVKATTDNDGTATMQLLPGRNSVSLRMHGCPERVERADVNPGVGVDDFKYVLDCKKK